MHIDKLQFAALAVAGALLAACPALAEDRNPEGQGQAVITVLNGSEIPGGIPQEAVHLKVDGKDSTVTGWTPLQSPASKIEVVILIDNGARESLGLQFKDIAKFIQGLPPDARVAVSYMMYGHAALAGPLTTDHAAAVRELHLPMRKMAGINASSYFCLSDLARHWPSTEAHARREVVMVTDGVDYYEMHYDPQDPHVQNAIDDSARAHLIVYAIYWNEQDRFDNTAYASDSGQNLLSQVTQATGGKSYWEGYGNPVTIVPYLDDIARRILNQYELDFMTPIGAKPKMANLRLKLNVHAKVDAPQQVYVHPGVE